ncbi:hypothetical protein R1sor_009137 [Riccia sorocarpa]|uniref:Uncharacterized protein n=1 Tax=Riccia sorocarpa TaxID=122646 RepID=A0ABD3H551_9MARC
MTNTRSKGKKARPSTAEHDIRLATVKVEPLKEKELLHVWSGKHHQPVGWRTTVVSLLIWYISIQCWEIADSFYSEVTPKPLKKVKKFVMEMSEDEKTPPPTPSVADQTPPPQPEVRDMEVHVEEVLEDLASTWKSKALEAVNGLLKPISTYVIPTPPTVDPEVENLKILVRKWQDLATSHHEQLRALASKAGKLQLTFLELEGKTAKLETTLAAQTKVKEIKETLFPKYLATLRDRRSKTLLALRSWKLIWRASAWIYPRRSLHLPPKHYAASYSLRWKDWREYY